MPNKKIFLPFFIQVNVNPTSVGAPYFLFGESYRHWKLNRIVWNAQAIGAGAGNYPTFGGTATAGGLSLVHIMMQLNEGSGINNTLIGDIADSYVNCTGETGFRVQFYQPGQYDFDHLIMNDNGVLAFTLTNGGAEIVAFYVSGYIEMEIIP